MEQEDCQSTVTNNVADEGTKFDDAVEESPFIDSSNSLQSDQSVSISTPSSTTDLGSNSTATISIDSKYSPESPSSPSSAGLRRRRLVSPPSGKESSASDFFRNNPDGLVDFDPRGTSVSPRKKYKISWSLKDNEKLNEKLNSATVRVSSGSVDKQSHEETDENSVITSPHDDEKLDDEKLDDESTSVDSRSSGLNLLFSLAELVMKAIGFQTNLLASSFTFPIWLMYSAYMFVTDPLGIMKRGRNYMLGNVTSIWGLCFGGVKWIVYSWITKHESKWKLCIRLGWGLLWVAYVCFVLIGLLVSSLVLSGIMMKWIVEEPMVMTEKLTFDYTRDNPVAFVPIMACQEPWCPECGGKIKLGSTAESHVIPFGHEVKATVSLTLPESDYNRNLGIFQVRVDFLSDSGKTLGSTRQPCMLRFKSQPIHLLSTFFKLAPLLTGYSSESQTLDVKFKGYTEKDVHTSCIRVVMEKRAEFSGGGGVPEMYAAYLKIESQLPFLKRVLWSWKAMIYVPTSIMIFTAELLFTLICCTPVIVPWVRRRRGSSNMNASQNIRPH